jgi:hypothetical protein
VLSAGRWAVQPGGPDQRRVLHVIWRAFPGVLVSHRRMRRCASGCTGRQRGLGVPVVPVSDRGG